MPSKMDMWEDPMLRDLEAELSEPFLPEQISWRVGSTNAAKDKGMALAYIDARDVMERLDGVVGIANWQVDYPDAGNGKTACKIGIFLDGQWVWKADGAGDSDIEAEKGALSDAFKRAAVRWGVGRYLYDVESPWVELEAAGRSFKIKDSEMARLAKLLGGVPKPEPEISAGETAALNAINTCKTRDEILDTLNRNKEAIVALANGGAERVKARARERLNEFPKPEPKKDAA